MPCTLPLVTSRTLLAIALGIALSEAAVSQGTTPQTRGTAPQTRGATLPPGGTVGEARAAGPEVFTTRPNPRKQLVPLPKEEGVFHFVVFGDRTGGEPEGIEVLRQAVHDTNLLDPDLVMTVGDLVNGYNARGEWLEQMQEYRQSMGKLRCPWFPVAGNHDIYWRGPDQPPGEHEQDYEMHFGPLWYSFAHKNAGFIVMYSDEGNPVTGEKNFQKPESQNVSPEQMAFLEQALERLKGKDHVFVFLHHPRWIGRGYAGTNWPEVHKLFVKAGNVTAVFGGHIHQMTYEGVQDGIEYLTTASVGAHLAADLPQAGYLHEFHVVTVRKDGIKMAAVPVGTLLDPTEFTPERIEEIAKLNSVVPILRSEPIPIRPGQSSSGTYKVMLTNPTGRPISVMFTAEGGPVWNFLPDHQHFTIAAGQSQVIALRYNNTLPSLDDFYVPRMTVQMEYLAETARVPLPPRQLEFQFKPSPPAENSLFGPADENRVLALSGSGAVRVESSDISLPDGPMTLECWISPADIQGSQGVVAKTQVSDYAIFMNDGKPEFSTFLGDRYRNAAASRPLAVDRWAHIAGVYTGSEVLLFVNGELVAKQAASGPRQMNELPLYLGADPDGKGQWTRPFTGKLDEIRLSKVARYTAPFKPQPHDKADADTVLLFHCDQAYGPFLRNEAVPTKPARLFGSAHLVPEEYTAKPALPVKVKVGE